MVFGSLLFSILLWVIGLFILYIVISAAVRDGINKSVAGQFLEISTGLQRVRIPFLIGTWIMTNKSLVPSI